jgi:hypothetical protein
MMLSLICCCIDHYQSKREESANLIIIGEIIKQFVTIKQTNKCFIYQLVAPLRAE